MKYIHSSEFTLQNTAVALGKFEGLHLGHQLLFQTAMAQKENGLPSVVFTFDTPPAVLFGKKPRKQIYTARERYHILEALGIDIMISYPFTREFAALEPEEFIREVLVKKAGASVVVVGKDFRFGRKRSGGVKELADFAPKYGYRLLALDKVQDHGEDISSSRIREEITRGNMEQAAALLGRQYFIEDQVVHGKALGKKIHIPTANQAVHESKLTPPNGVYVSRILMGGKEYYGITNIGTKPTVKSDDVKGAETHIFHYEGEIYDQTIHVELLHFCRPERKFDAVEDLVNQMQRDIKYAKEFLELS